MNPSLSRRLLTMLAVLGAGLSLVFVLPEAPQQPPAGVSMTLPDFVGEWYGQEADVTDRERSILGPETRFARKQYTNGRGSSFLVSVVFSGEDMTTSIHRPERCLPAQGFTIAAASKVKIPLRSPRPLTVTRLFNLRPLYDKEGKPLMFSDGRQVNDSSLVYYWFIGSRETTADHTQRYMLDARDRVLTGTTQRWAYVTVMSRITGKLDKYGLDEAQTDALMRDFVQKLLPLIQRGDIKIR